MRWISLAAASTLALSAAACAPHGDPAARVRLDCPERQGDLVRVSMAADGKTCGYRAGGVDVSLQLTPVSGDPMTTLNSVENSLVATASQPASTKKAAESGPPTPPTTTSPDDVAQAARQAEADAGGSGGDHDWSTGTDKHDGGVTADNDSAHVDLPGLHIDADGDNAKVDIAGIHIDAAQDAATVRVVRDVRLLGHPFSRRKEGIRATFIAKRDGLPDGYRFVGYEASGPRVGPLTIALVRSREELNDGDHLYHDIQRLVRRNGGA